MGDTKEDAKRGSRSYNRYLRTEESVPRSTFYKKRKLTESQDVNNPASTADNMASVSSLSDAEEVTSPETFNRESNLSDFEVDKISLNSSDSDDDDLFQKDSIKVNLKNLNELLYPSSCVTLLEAYVSILAFSLRHNLTKTCMQDLLQLLNLLLPPSNLPSTNHLFYSKLSSLFDNSTEAYIYCKFCFTNICLLSDENKPDVCPECFKIFDLKDCMKQGYFFMYMPLEPQLKLKFQFQNVMNSVKKYKSIFEQPSSSYRDILDGEAYSQIKNLKNTDNISLQFNIDGIPMYKKSNYQIWPIQCMINELPPYERKNHILMCGLWFGPRKPPMNDFLKPFVCELSTLSESGLKWMNAADGKPTVTKVFPIICSSDAPARAAIQNFIQYNGKYGCGFCEHSGERIEKGKGFCRIYPFEQPPPEIRSFEKCVRFAEEATLTGKAVCGVKGPSELMILYPHFDLVKSFVPDYMHAVLLGVVRQILYLWIQTSSKEFSLSQKSQKILNERISSISFTQETTRKLRSTNDVLFWKASEFRTFLLVSPAVTKNLIHKNVYNHWLLLVHGITLLLGNEITSDDLEEAEFALQKFVNGVKDIYGLEEHSYNIHLLLHLPMAVKSWGPLWAHSCFLYEDALGKLKQFHHGTRGEANQILSSYAMQSVLKLLILQGNVKNSQVQFYIQSQQRKCQSEKNPKINDCTFLGLPKSLQLPRVQELQVLKLVATNHQTIPAVTSYSRMLYRNKIFNTKGYSQKFLRADYVVSVGKNVCFAINNIIVHNGEVFLIGEKLSVKQLKRSDSDIGLLCRNVLLCENLDSDIVLAIRPVDIINKYVIVPFKDKDKEIIYLIPINNVAEQ